MRKEIFSIRNVSKINNTLLPLEKTSLDFYVGEVVSFLGTLNSGISTLSDVLSGIQRVDSGLFYDENGEFEMNSSNNAHKKGIYCVKTQTALLEEFTILDNVFLLTRKVLKNLMSYSTVVNCIKVLFYDYCERLGVEVDPNTRTYFLSDYQKSVIEIICAIINGAKMIIIDNVLDNCAESEFKLFKEMLSKITNLGVSVVVMTARAQVALNTSDRILIVRRGHVIEMPYRHMLKREEILQILASAELRTPESLKNSNGRILLSAKNFCVNSDTIPFDFDIKENEIVGFMHNNEPYDGVLYALSGQLNYNGNVFIDNQEIVIDSLSVARKWNIGYMSGYHKKQIFYNLSIVENLLLMIYPRLMSIAGSIRKKLIEVSITDFANLLNVKTEFLRCTPDEVDTNYEVLIPLMRWIVARPKILLLDVPYRFADVVIANRITEYLDIIKSNGTGCVLYSTQASELYDSCNRIYFIDDRKIFTSENNEIDNY